jgi:hypothetical protein
MQTKIPTSWLVRDAVEQLTSVANSLRSSFVHRRLDIHDVRVNFILLPLGK